ncbi:MAG: radical SAM protein [Bacteroidetes bacterium]|nr:radical SAM protein [Bacteroidota bacterium]
MFLLSKRRRRLAYKRLTSIPSGLDLFRYFINRGIGYFLRMTGSTKVAHPSSIMLEVTNHCNLACVICPLEFELGQKMEKGFIDLDKFKKVVDEAYPYVDSVGLTGLGETFMYKQLEEAAAYVRSKSNGIIMFVSINAHLPNSVEIAERVGELVDSIQISIDGIDEVYEAIRKKSDYGIFKENVIQICQRLKGMRAELSFNGVIYKDNYKQMLPILELARMLDIDTVSFNSFNLVAAHSHSIEEYEFYSTTEFTDELRSARNLAEELGIELTTFDFDTAPGFRKCMYPWSHFYISWDGYMTPCCAKPFPQELHFGNVFEDGLMKCLNSNGFRNFRSMWYRNETPEFCEKCHMIELTVISEQ